MKKTITVDYLKRIVQDYIRVEQDEMENSTEWAYVYLEPEILSSKEATLGFLKGMVKLEFDAIAYLFDEIVYKFNSVEILSVIQNKYAEFYGDNKNTDIYNESIKGLENCIR